MSVIFIFVIGFMIVIVIATINMVIIIINAVYNVIRMSIIIIPVNKNRIYSTYPIFISIFQTIVLNGILKTVATPVSISSY